MHSICLGAARVEHFKTKMSHISISHIFSEMSWDADTVAALRAATPGTENVVHFNNAGSSLPTKRTLDAVVGYLTSEANYGGYVR